MSLIIRNLTAGAIALDDIGIEIPGLSDFDMLNEAAADVANSADLVANITATDIVVLDPRDSVTELTPSNSIIVIQSHNDPHFGIRGANLDHLDDVDLTGAVQGDVLQLNGSGDYVVVSPGALAGDIALGDLSDVTDGTGHVASIPYILVGNGSGQHVMESAITSPSFIEVIEDRVGGMIGTTGDVSVVYSDATGVINFAVNDVFLFNTGDTLDSGTLSVASGASIAVQTGADLTIADPPINGIDATNKDYVDSVASGLDTKDSVHLASTPAGGNYAGYSAVGGTTGTGSFTGIDVLNMDAGGQLPTIGDRILIKDQTDAKQNGIYAVTAVGGSPLGTATDLERSTDMDGSPAAEVSAGNHAFVEHGVQNANTSWVVTGSGTLTLNTDDINWSQFSGSGSFTAGIGLGLSGTQFFLDLDNLTAVTIDPADEIAFNDVSDGAGVAKNTTVSDFITDLGIFTDTNLTASDGVLITAGGDIQLDITNLAFNPGAISLASEMVFDSGGSGTHFKGTIQQFFDGTDVPHGISADGILVRTTEDTYASVEVAPSAVASEEGILITNGGGYSGSPQSATNIIVGLDIQGTADSITNMSSSDEFLMFNGTNNVAVSGQQISAGVSAILGGLGNAYTNIAGDTGTAIAASSTDTLEFIGAVNGGITTVAADSAPDSVTFAIDIDDLATGGGTVDLTDEIGVSEGAGTTVKYTFSDVLTDLGVPSNLSTSAGILVSDGAGSYTATQIITSGVGNSDGLSITNGNGVTGSPIGADIEIGLDITGTPAAGEDFAAADEIIAYNNDATANEKFTGQEVADGVATMLGFSGIAVTTINGQEVLTLADTTRANKILSVGDTSVSWSEKRVSNNDWLQIGTVVDAQSGYIVPLNATIVKITAHTEDNNGNTKPINLYIDGVASGTVGTFAGLSGEDKFSDVTLNIDVNQDQKLRLRGGTGGAIQDTVITLWLKWRG